MDHHVSIRWSVLPSISPSIGPSVTSLPRCKVAQYGLIFLEVHMWRLNFDGDGQTNAMVGTVSVCFLVSLFLSVLCFLSCFLLPCTGTVFGDLDTSVLTFIPSFLWSTTSIDRILWVYCYHRPVCNRQYEREREKEWKRERERGRRRRPMAKSRLVRWEWFSLLTCLSPLLSLLARFEKW